MNKKEFNYYLKNKEKITAPILGLMMLYEEAEIRVTHKYILPDKLIKEVMRSIGSEGDWVGYRNILGMINSLRYNFVEAEVYKRSAFNNIEKIKALYRKLYLNIILSIQEPNEILKAVIEQGDIKNTDKTEAEAIKLYRADLGECILRVVAYNRFVMLLAKETETPSLKSFFVNIEPLKEALEELTEASKKLKSTVEFLPKELKEIIESMPIMEFNFSKFEPPKKHQNIVREMIQENGSFLSNDERVNNSFIRYLIYGGV